jgi:GNAT superfamily N-acetyltransferase
MSVLIRPAVPTDLPYITTAWLSTFASSKHASELRVCKALQNYAPMLEPNRPASAYYALHRMAIMACLKRPTTVLWVACSEEDPDTLVGFVCGEPKEWLLHYVCVKQPYQGAGIGRQLVEAMHELCKQAHIDDDDHDNSLWGEQMTLTHDAEGLNWDRKGMLRKLCHRGRIDEFFSGKN